MISTFLFVSSLFSAVLGCAPGTGILGTKGTFAFEMIPPTLYTYSSKGENYGQINQDFADRALKSDVQNAINEVLQANSIPLNDVNPPVTTYIPPNVELVDANCAANQTLVYDKKAYYFCKDATTKEPFSVPLQIQITALQAIYESQWKALAIQVQNKLTTKRSAEFLTDPIITVQ